MARLWPCSGTFIFCVEQYTHQTPQHHRHHHHHPQSLGFSLHMHAHTNKSLLTLAFGPSMPRATSWATVCSRRLLSSACCRRSLISSRVSSSGCTERHTQRRTAKHHSDLFLIILRSAEMWFHPECCDLAFSDILLTVTRLQFKPEVKPAADPKISKHGVLSSRKVKSI